MSVMDRSEAGHRLPAERYTEEIQEVIMTSILDGDYRLHFDAQHTAEQRAGQVGMVLKALGPKLFQVTVEVSETEARFRPRHEED